MINNINTIIFWAIIIMMTAMALGFVLPWLQSKRLKIGFSFLILLASFGAYWQLGSGPMLPEYYSKEAQILRHRQDKTRILLADLRKKEFKLQLKIEENPDDIEAQWNLLNVKGIYAYQLGYYPLAVEYWQKALELMPDTVEGNVFKNMIKKLIENAKINLKQD